ncbi:MAG: hypothetical protein IJF25_05300 [Oscillospiraceae bacterium]|nr:hypothetical protein [Oscillospiraceae bacterium]MBQ4539119.1 hypothetical protein [Oscillospiraceae bacterium]
MKAKKVCFTEAAYFIGIFILALGTALMEKANFGMSMVVAPAYLLHLKLSQHYPIFSFGMAEYIFQAILIVILTAIMRNFKKSYLFSFVTAVIYGFALDIMIWAVRAVPSEGVIIRTVLFMLGLLFGTIGVAFLFHTYIAPEAYELVVKEISLSRGIKIEKVKTVYDCISCAVGILMSFAFFGFGQFEGVKLGTIFCALINGKLIGLIGGALESSFEFKDALKLREMFNK